MTVAALRTADNTTYALRPSTHEELRASSSHEGDVGRLDDVACQPGQSVVHRACDIQPLAVLEAEQALLSFWMMRGGGESGDVAFRQEDGEQQSLNAERLAGVVSEPTRTSPARAHC